MMRASTVLSSFVLGVTSVAAQVPEPPLPCTAATAGALPGVGGVLADYHRAVNLLADSLMYVVIRRPSHPPGRVEVPCDAPWRTAERGAPHGDTTYAAAAYFDAIFNSGYPHGNRTGLLWPGRGVGMLWTVGVETRVGPLHLGLYPQLAYQQNREFPFVPFAGDSGSVYAYPWPRGAASQRPDIDWPQRHGDATFWSASLGQSFVSVELAGVRAGVSAENLWWGPAVRNSILLGNEAAGIPHVFLGTPRGIPTPVGRFTAELLWGRLAESDYFNDDPTDDHRFLTGVNVSFQPRGVGGLSLGGARLYYQPYDDLSPSDLLPFLESPFKADLVTPDNPAGDDIADQLFGVYARYAIPRTGFELYAEWTRNDHSENIRDFYAEPDHSRAYTLGFQQVIRARGVWLRLAGEITQLALTRTVTHRPAPSYYTHHLIRQGYTHRGQLLGAAIGPGSEAQFLGLDVFMQSGSHGIFVERVRYNEDIYYRHVSSRFGALGHDVEVSGGSRHLVRLGPLDVSLSIGYSSRRNRTFRHCNPNLPLRDCRLPVFRDINWHIPVGLAWRFD